MAMSNIAAFTGLLVRSKAALTFTFVGRPRQNMLLGRASGTSRSVPPRLMQPLQNFSMDRGQRRATALYFAFKPVFVRRTPWTRLKSVQLGCVVRVSSSNRWTGNNSISG